MAHPLDTTPGGPDSDSYATLLEADDRALHFGRTDWDAFTDDEKNAALRRAVVWLDNTYRDRYPGERVNGREQSLSWIRKDAYDCTGITIPDDAIPIEIINSQIEAAFREAVAPGSLAPDYVPAGNVKSEQVDVLRTEFFSPSGGASSVLTVIHIVDGLLGCIVSKAGSGQFLERA